MAIKKNMGFERELLGLTTIIISKFNINGSMITSQASGFYYNEMTPVDPNKKGPQWHRIDAHWLITNRHVVLYKQDNEEFLPEELIFCFRKVVDSKIEWDPIVLTKEDIKATLRLHTESNIDVALIDVSKYYQNYCKKAAENNPEKYILPLSLSNLKLPEENALEIDVTSDVIVASYPKGFYDDWNKFPIIKSGIIASGWNFSFKGQPIFQIDAQLFPGSSGGLVISKPTNLAMIDGKICTNQNKDYVFLGIYSGEYYWKEIIEVIDGKQIEKHNSYGLGNVWYSYLVQDIIKEGIKFN